MSKKMLSTSLLGVAGLAVSLSAACSESAGKDGDCCAADSGGRVPGFTMKALTSPHVHEANFFVSSDGTIVRSTAYLKRKGIPDWVHAMADEKIGKGEDVAFEVEVYPNGTEVFEIYRTIGGNKKQLGVTADRKVYYLGTEHPKDDLPAAVSGAVGKMKGFEVERCMAKEGPTFFEYHVRGTLDGNSDRARIGKDGRLIALQRRIPADVEIETTR